ncbi:hypothetical protein CRYUN_Cryun29cG0016500 [Craigia yunnanensis]
MQNGGFSQVRQGFVSQRAISSRVHVWVTTTVRTSVEMKVSPVATVEDSVTAASALRFADHGRNLKLSTSLQFVVFGFRVSCMYQ